MTPYQATITPLLSAKKFLIIANIAESELDNDAYVRNPHYIQECKHLVQKM